MDTGSSSSLELPQQVWIKVDSLQTRPIARSTQQCRQLTISEIHLATRNFDESLVIGRGGFGIVYKGTITVGDTNLVAAIKRLDSTSNQGAAEFWNEVQMLSRLRHCHLVSLIGYYNDGQEMILAYEYMPHGTLEDHLHKFQSPLPWVRRLKICIGAARGLDYLHTGTGIKAGVIHRDVKSSNILLDENWAAKISDFGLSKNGPINQPATYVNTFVKGTFGYLDPDYYATGRLTRKSDVYAFGVVLFEVLTGKRAVDRSLDEEHWGLVNWAQESVKEGRLKQIVDSTITEKILPKCLKEFARLADRCVHSNPKQRPTMAEVVFSLESVLALQEKANNTLHPAGMRVFGNMMPMFLPWSNAEKYGDGTRNARNTIYRFSQLVTAKELTFLETDEGVALLQIIGRGTCGDVYMCELPKREVNAIAIKKTELSKDNTERINWQMRRIKAEIQTIGQTRHRNLLPLLAHVSGPECHYLVYKYMKNGTLQDILTQVKEGSREFDWLARHRVALGVAVGLEYLHISHSPRIIHRDIKPRHVLLDDDMEARITGFGLARAIPDANTHMTSSSVAGTLGYIAPEYHQTMEFSDKCDIYSFGVLLAALVMGKFPSDEFFQQTYDISLVKWMRNVMSSENPKQAVDPKLLGNGYEEQMLLVLKIACFCTLDNAKERPNSKDVRVMLSQITH
ncbi:hypothetical protein LXL04_001342 [Taraxacum kok-saghyz]